MEDPVIDSDYRREVYLACRLFWHFVVVKKIILPHELLRLAWNDARTYDAKTGTGGANGSIRHWERLKIDRDEKRQKIDSYEEMRKALHICEEVKDHCPRLTYADIIQIGGVIAIEVVGGPFIPFVPGRKDALASPEEAYFPDANLNPGSKDWLSKFHQMGLTDVKDIVALIGGMTLGRAYKESLERKQTSCVAPVVFDNSYFVNLPRAEADNWISSPSDRTLLQSCNFRRYIDLYAKDKDVFLQDYAVAHKKFSEFGLPRIAADQENNLLLMNNQFITIQKNVENPDYCIHTLFFYGSEYEITSTPKPHVVNSWIERNVTKCSKIRDIVGIGPMWETKAEGPPRILAICLSTNKILVNHIFRSGNHVPQKIRDFLMNENFQKTALLKWDKRKLKDTKSDSKHKIVVTKFRSAQELIPKTRLSQMKKPITMTDFANYELRLPDGFEISEDILMSNLKDPLDEEKILAAAIKSVLAYLMSVKYNKSSTVRTTPY